MVLLRTNAPHLFTPIYDKLMAETFGEPTLVMNQVFTILTDNSKQVDTDSISGLGEWEESGEHEALVYDDPIPGYPKTFLHLKYRKGFQVSFEARNDDEYALVKKMGKASDMGRGARVKVEKLGSTIFNNAFTSGTGPDSVYLCHTQHPKNSLESTTYYSNKITSAFDHDALEEMELKINDNWFNSRGMPVEVRPTILLHPPALRGAVHRVLDDRAKDRPETQDRDINIYANRYTPVEWRYLGASLGGSDTAWFLITLNMGLEWYWRERPHFTSWVVNNTQDYSFEGTMRASAGWRDWRFVCGSTGAG